MQFRSMMRYEEKSCAHTHNSITVKTACSSALICLHMACEAIRSGEITSAIVGGANLLMSPTMTIAMSEQGVLSADGSSKTFDAAADGYARGEAINALYVKRLDEAIRDRNPIRAIVRSTGTNCDGKTAGLSHPSLENQEALIRQTYESAGIHDFCQTAFVECHGTGTATGMILTFLIFLSLSKYIKSGSHLPSGVCRRSNRDERNWECLWGKRSVHHISKDKAMIQLGSCQLTLDFFID
jgi:hypothetical protein